MPLSPGLVRGAYKQEEDRIFAWSDGDRTRG